jgi:hypothetical protein
MNNPPNRVVMKGMFTVVQLDWALREKKLALAVAVTFKKAGQSRRHRKKQKRMNQMNLAFPLSDGMVVNSNSRLKAHGIKRGMKVALLSTLMRGYLEQHLYSQPCSNMYIILLQSK